MKILINSILKKNKVNQRRNQNNNKITSILDKENKTAATVSKSIRVANKRIIIKVKK